MLDRREAILARLAVLAGTIPGIRSGVRNPLELSERNRPAIAILDADELVEVDQVTGRANRGAAIVSMTPDVFILLQDAPADVGTSLNAFRRLWIKAVMTDSELASLTGNNGEIRYEGCVTGLSRGRQMEGEVSVQIAFRYPLILSEL